MWRDVYMSLRLANKVIRPMLERKAEIEEMTIQQKIEVIKETYNLSHGNGKRKRKRKKR